MAQIGFGDLDMLANDKSTPASFSSIAGALIPAALVAVSYLTAFIAIRSRFPSQYSGRTFSRIIAEKDRTPSTSTSATAWFHDYWNLDDTFVLKHHSFDAFLYLRFFRFLVLICFVGCCLTWPILFPLNATGGGTAQQLDVLSYANIAKTNHLWGHATVGVIFFTAVIVLINGERMFLIGFRQAYLTTKVQAHRLSSRTALFLAPPRDLRDEAQFKRTFGDKVSRTWHVPKLNDLAELVDGRNQKVYDLELAELRLEQNIVAQHKGGGSAKGNNNDLEQGQDSSADDPHARPTHRSPPLVGSKLDSVDHLLEAVPDLNDKIKKLRDRHAKDNQSQLAAIIVEFEDQASAHQAYRQIYHHDPLVLQPRYIGIPPGNIQWQNLAINPSLRITNTYIAIALVLATIVFWSIPVGLVGTISNIQALADTYSWLDWYNRLPASARGLIQGFVPPYALSFLTSYVPFWFRYIATQLGAPTAQDAQHFTQRWFFVFQFLQVFLVTALSSGAATIINRVANNPGQVPKLLADNLPKSATFYMTYFTLQGLSSSANDIIKTSDLFQYLFFKYLWDTTPRQKYERETQMKALFYGSKYPKFTNMTVIAIVYACIAPLLLGFAAIGFAIFYLTNRYLYLYSNNVKLEMKGAAHALALKQMYTGVYMAEIFLIGLFSLREVKGPTILMGVFLILTAIHHITVNRYLSPYEEHIPLDILHESVSDSTDSPSAPLLHPSASSPLSHPPLFLPTLPSFLPTHILPSILQLTPHLTSSRTSPPTYTETQLKNAYLHPALTAKPPLVWIPKDPNGISEEMKKRNETRAGLETSDEGAEMDNRGRVVWEEGDLSKAAIFKQGTLW